VQHWLARLYSRPDIEKHLKRIPPNDDGREPGVVRDIWDAQILRTFRGPDEKHFLDAPGDEGRVVFSMCFDGFNPYRMREAGKKVSTGAVYLVCLNLPPSIRYKVENICLVGIIPGPREPSQHQINH
jgi:hypothetical protein